VRARGKENTRDLTGAAGAAANGGVDHRKRMPAENPAKPRETSKRAPTLLKEK